MAPEPLPAPLASLVAASAALATRDSRRVDEALRDALRYAEPLMVEEMILQSHLFVGFPDALHALARWRDLSDGPVRYQPESEASADFRARGEAMCARVYGGSYEKLRANVVRLHPAMDEWMVTGGYGRVLGRPGLDLVARELCIVALLVVWHVPRQLHSHLRGALNVGASVAQLNAAVRLAAASAGPEAAAAALSLWDEVRTRRGHAAPV